MKTSSRVLLLASAAATALLAAYSYYYSDTFTSIDLAKWTQVGSLTPTANGLTAPSGGGNLYSTLAVPDGTSDYEVKFTIRLQGAANGEYWANLRSTYNGSAWTNYSLEYKPTYINGSVCNGELRLNKLSPGWQLLSTTHVDCHDGMVIRAVMKGSTIIAYIDSNPWLSYTDSSPLATGKPGVGAYSTPSGTSISSASLGGLDRTAPSAVSSISSSAQTNRVDLSWPAASDDANGIGVWGYSIYRNGLYMLSVVAPATTYTDYAVGPGAMYSYDIRTVDWHQNFSAPVNATVTTPGGAPGRIGVRSTGAYWGAAGEKIDMLSGNLTWTQPVLKAMGRGGWGAGFALSYNSQLWWKDGANPSQKRGADVGYGFGWKLLAGALTKYYGGGTPAPVAGYIFTDSTGAEYRLDQKTVNGTGFLWTAREAIYVTYDDTTNKLLFPDGSFWLMGCTSQSPEPDAGTTYPTLMQDTNGNQVIVKYRPRVGSETADTSARIDSVEDVRATSQSGTYKTYSFTYNADATPHLTGIVDYIGSNEWVNFTYTTKTLVSPFDGSAFGTATVLHGVQRATGSTALDYDGGAASGPAELTKVTFPYGAYFRWAHATFSYSGSKQLRQVSNRYLLKAVGAAETNYVLWYDTTVNTSHGWSCIDDPSTIGQRCWLFDSNQDWRLGLLLTLEERPSPWVTAVRKQVYTWAQDDVLNPYIASALTTLDPGLSSMKQSLTEQTVDRNGNTVLIKQYNYGSGSSPEATPSRTYVNTYLTGTNYTSRNIYNRLVTSTLNGVTLTWNTYDGTGVAAVTAPREHDSANYGTSFNYRGNVSQTVSMGNTVNRSYDMTGVAIGSNDGQGHSSSATMTSNNAVPSQITSNGLSSQFSYNSFLGVTGATGANNETAVFGYDVTTSRPSTTTSPHGAITTYDYNDSTSPFKVATTNGKWVKTWMDGLGRTIKVESGYGTTTVSKVDTQYDSCACSPVGKVKQVSQPYSGASASAWTVNTYDGLGRTVSVAHPGGTGTTTYNYSGNTTTVTDPAGKWKTYVSDAFGNLTQVVEPDPAAPPFTPIRINTGGTAYTDPSGNVWAADSGYSPTGGTTSTTSAIANTTSDPLYQNNRGWSAGTTGQYQFTVPNGSYNVTLKWAEIYNGGSPRIFNVTINGTQVLTNFNVGQYWLTAFDQTFATTATAGVITIQFYSATYAPTINAIEITAAGGGGGTTLTTNYTYNQYGKLTGVSMPRGGTTQTRTWNYNATTQRLDSVTMPENGTTAFTYNTDGTLQKKVDAKGQEIRYTYDANQRVSEIRRFTNATTEDVCQKVTFTYGTAAPSKGRLVTATWGGASCANTGNRTFSDSYTYTASGLVLTKRLNVDAKFLEATYTYDNEGKATSVKYPTTYTTPQNSVPGVKYTYAFDSMGRPNKLTDDAATPVDWVKNVSYGVASELQSLDYYTGAPTVYLTETRGYNVRLQMTSLNVTGGAGVAPLQLAYNYSATQNNGRITSQQDVISGETITYQYDSLNRLISAATNTPSGGQTFAEWGQNYTYDGFGNLTAQSMTKGTGPNYTLSVSGSTNRITTSGHVYDANGNAVAMPGKSGPCASNSQMCFDVDNRLTSATVSGNTDTYGYAPDNRRVWKKKQDGSQELYFYGLGGQRLGTYIPKVDSQYGLYIDAGSTNVYFGSKLIRAGGQVVVTDRLGSVRRMGTTSRYYFPYGEEPTPGTPDGIDKFATYYRDGTTGLDYADQRYYGSTVGRFLTSDPYQASGGASDPGSWNRYAYVQGDPIKYYDPRGLVIYCPAGDGCKAPPGSDGGVGGGGGGGGGDTPLPDDWGRGGGDDGGGGGGGSASPSPPSIDEAKKRMVDRIDDDCAEALGFKDSAGALAGRGRNGCSGCP